MRGYPTLYFTAKSAKFFSFGSHLANAKFAKPYQHKALRTLRLYKTTHIKKPLSTLRLIIHKPEQKLYQHKALRTLRLYKTTHIKKPLRALR